MSSLVRGKVNVVDGDPAAEKVHVGDLVGQVVSGVRDSGQAGGKVRILDGLVAVEEVRFQERYFQFNMRRNSVAVEIVSGLIGDILTREDVVFPLRGDVMCALGIGSDQGSMDVEGPQPKMHHAVGDA